MDSCVPVVLSDDLVWAFTEQTGGPLNHSQFSLQLPQAVVQFTAEKTLRTYRSRKADLGVLPLSGTLLYDLLERSVQRGGSFIDGLFVNPLVQILLEIPAAEVDYLQQGVAALAPRFRYYAMNASMASIPTATHAPPDGEALDILATMLSQRKRRGLAALKDDCQRERSRKGHKYISRFSCDAERADSLLKRR
jgi:hypothetical protein